MGDKNPKPINPDAPAGGGGQGRFKVPRTPGTIDLNVYDGDARNQSTVPTTPAVSMANLMKGVANVDRGDRRAFDDTFDWRSTFLADGKWALIPEPINENAASIRARMMRMLASTSLAREVYTELVVVTQRQRVERAAWILGSGELGKAATGTTQEVASAPKPAGNVVGYVHTHPTIPNFINPPSAGRPDNDFDSTLETHPIQIVVESHRGRVWAQFTPRHTAMLGRITPPKGTFQPLDDRDPVSKLLYKIISIDDWNMMQEQKEREDRARERERIRQLHH